MEKQSLIQQLNELLDFLSSDPDLRVWAIRRLTKEKDDNDPRSGDRKQYTALARQDIEKLAKEF